MEPNDLDQFKSELAAEIEMDFAARHAKNDPAEGFGAGVFDGLAVNVLRNNIPELIRAAVDTAVASFGERASDLVLRQKEAIRRVISERTLEYLDGIVHGLRDARAGA